MILIGTGNMAKEYARVFHHLGLPFVTIGNTDLGSLTFSKWLREHSIFAEVIPGGVTGKILKGQEVVVAVPIPLLYETTKNLILKGARKILVEKPGVLYSIQARALVHLSDSYKADIYVGYNRRFYKSVQEARDIIRRDGVEKLHFSFGEDIEWLKGSSHHVKSVKDRWIIANASHCIDTALFLLDAPVQGMFVETVNPFRGSGFAGNTQFTYRTDWTKDRRWKIEFVTKRKETYCLGPFEKLVRKENGNSSTVLAYDTDELKPGVQGMVSSFLGDQKDLLTIKQQQDRLLLYMKMGGLAE